MDSHLNYRKKIDRFLLERRLAVRTVKAEQTALADAERRLSTTTDARKLVQTVAEAVQRTAHKRIADVVSRCLEAVFGEDAYTFKIDFKQSRGKTEARLMFERGGQEIDPLSASGGGVVDLAAFALRLACLILSKPAKCRLLVLDEPFKHLSRDKRPLVRDLLLRLAKEMKLQVMLVTHDPEFQIGKVVEL